MADTERAACLEVAAFGVETDMEELLVGIVQEATGLASAPLAH